MSELSIQVEGLSKKYKIGQTHKQHNRLGDQLVASVVSPFRRVGRLLQGRSTNASALEQDFWALRDVSFEIQHGEIVGVIGHNGAGKSTLLKILSRITEPTEGYADIFGRVGSLLEVGTGFHPELTGRENIYLNGSILGMRRSEINQKFDAIVDFAEIEQFIDTPVKHYSSGMYVRLAFSVAAHLEPEILLIDEVLAVGDVSFQKKSLGKMEDISQQGRTVIFVSHNMNALQRLCPQSILLNRGEMVMKDRTSRVIEEYLSTVSSEVSRPNTKIDLSSHKRDGTGKITFDSFVYAGDNSAVAFHPYANGSLDVSVNLTSKTDCAVGSIAVVIFDRYGTKLINADTRSFGEPIELRKGENSIKFRIEQLHLSPGIYTIGFWVADPPLEVYDHITSAALLEVVETEADKIRVSDDGLVPIEFAVSHVAS